MSSRTKTNKFSTTNHRILTTRQKTNRNFSKALTIVVSCLTVLQTSAPCCYAQSQKPILDTRTDLSSTKLSPAARQPGEQIQVTGLIQKLEHLRKQSKDTNLSAIEKLTLRQEFLETRQDIFEQIEKTRLEIEFALARLNEEMSLYTELMEAYGAERNRKVAHTNLLAFATNGVMWTIAEGLTIPTYRVPSLSVGSGVVGILAGITPSVFSALAIKLIEGRPHRPKELPNMLSKIFGYPTTQNTEYPESVWKFLNTVPDGDTGEGTRKEQIIQHWIRDNYIPSFTKRDSSEQLDRLIGDGTRERYKLTIALLRDRRTMLQQLHAQISKMNRLLLELLMVMRGEKIYKPEPEPITQHPEPTSILQSLSPAPLELEQKKTTEM